MFRPRRRGRYIRLLDAGFLRFEARVLSSISYRRAPYLKNMISERQNIYAAVKREAVVNKWSQTRFEWEYRNVIRNEYKEHKWFTPRAIMRIGMAGNLDAYKMLKSFRRQAIDSGSYKVPSRGSHRIYGDKTDKGDIKAQKERARERGKSHHKIDQSQYH